jgi:hypothetical protein
LIATNGGGCGDLAEYAAGLGNEATVGGPEMEKREKREKREEGKRSKVVCVGVDAQGDGVAINGKRKDKLGEIPSRAGH